MYKEWLNRKFTIEEMERIHLSQDDRIDPDPVPFGYYNSFWKELKSQLQEGDEIWTFSSPKDSWMNNCGRAEVCIVRKGEIVHYFNTIIN